MGILEETIRMLIIDTDLILNFLLIPFKIVGAFTKIAVGLL